MKNRLNQFAFILLSTFGLFSMAAMASAETNFKNLLLFDFRYDFLTTQKSLLLKWDDFSPETVFQVNTTAGTFDGVCDAANCSLRDAVHAANANGAAADTINVPAGTYTFNVIDNSPGDGNNALAVVTGAIIIQGAGAASTIIERSSAGGTPDFRFFKIAGGQLALNGLTFRNARANGPGGVIVLGGNSSDMLTVNNCLFDGNVSANNSGGAIGASVGQTVINNSTFTNNSASSGGGAIYGGLNMVSLTITNSVFTGNNTLGNGGAIVNDREPGSSSIVISGSAFTGNTAGQGGGAIFSVTAFNAALALNISNSTFSGNSSVNQSGGAIVGPQITINNSTVSGNSSAAGAIISNNSTPNTSITISNSTISGNTSSPNSSVASAIEGTAVTVTNSTVSGNSGFRGAGIQASGSNSSMNLNNVTVTNNTASTVGGGIFIANGTPSNIRNAIIAGNTATGGGNDCSVGFMGSIVSQGYNLIGNGDDCSFTPTTGDHVGNTANPINPQVGALQNNGGGTFTHALLANSPAINAANPNTPDGTGNDCLPQDQRGANRGVTGTTEHCDIGASESNLNAAPQISISDAQIINNKAVFTVTLTNAADVFVAVNYATGDGTAVAGIDYAAASGTLNFALNQFSKTIEIPVSPNTVGEPDENFYVNLSNPNPANSTIVDAQGEAVIPRLSVFSLSNTAYSISEGAGSITLTVNRTQGAGTASVNFSTADGTATAGADYAAASGTLVFSGAETLKTFTVNITGDNLSEPDETFSIALSDPSVNATLGTPNAATVTILNVNRFADIAVSLAEADNQDPVNVGTTFAYRITLTNNGPDTAAEAVAILPFPAEATLQFPVAPGCSFGENPFRIFCSAPNLESGTSRSFDVGLTPHAGILPRTMTATAELIHSIPDDPNATNNSDSETTTIVQNAANLSLTGADSPDPVGIGSTVTYTFTAGNSGPGNSLGLRFKAVLPDGFTNVAAGAPNSTCTVTNTRIVNCAANQQSSFLAPNATRNFTVTATAPNESGTAAVDAEVDAYYSTPKKTARVETRIRGNADLTISSANASPDTVFVGQKMTFDFNVRNEGVTDALDSRLVFPLPANTIYDGGSSGCSYKIASNQVICTLGTIRPNGLVKRRISVVPQAAAVTFPTFPNNPPRVEGTGTVTSLDDTNNANNSATVSSVVSDAADLIVTHTSSVQQVFGDVDIEYVIRVRNNGLSIARNVSLVSSKPLALNYVGAGAVVDNNGGSCIRENAQVRCNLGTILSGAEKIARLTVRTAQTGIYTTTASATAATADLNWLNNSRKATVQVTNSAFAADVRVGSFTATNNAPRVEDVYDVSLTATNDGPNAANDVFVRTVFGEGTGELELVSAQNGSIQDGEAAFNLGTLAVNETRTVTVTVKAIREGTAPIFGKITTSNGDGNSANNQTNSVPTIAPRVKGDLAVMASIPIFQKKELDLGAFIPRPQLASGIHTVVVKNLGSFNVTGAVLTTKNYAIKGQNVNPASLNGSMISPVGVWIRLDNGNNLVAAGACEITLGGSEFPTLVRDPQTIFTCQVGVIPVGHTVTLLSSYDVVREAIGFGIIRVSANEFDPNLLNNESTIFAPPYVDNLSSDSFNSLSKSNTVATQNVALNLGAAFINFAQVNTSGSTTIEQISPEAAGIMPEDFTVAGGNLAYDIKTTADVSSTINVCFPVTSVGDAASFNRLSILHNENGQLVDRTLSRDFATKIICAQTTSLSSFILVQQTNSNLLQISGAVTKNGSAVNDAQARVVDLSNPGDDSVNLRTVTDVAGNYKLVNLLPNKDYTVIVSYDSSVSNPSEITFNNMTANQTADFTLAPAPVAATSSVQFAQTSYPVNENGGNASLTVTRSGNLSSAAMAMYQITGNSAQDSSDFQAANGTVNFAANETTKTISVLIINDAFNEPAEDFSVTLGPLAGSSTIGANGTTIVTINDDDPLPTLSVSSAGFTEGNAGTNFAVFNVSLSAASNEAISAIYTTTAGTAAPGSDYTETTAIVTIPAGATSGTISIPVLGDPTFEPNETFTVTLSAAANATISGANAVGTILNDDLSPSAANVSIGGRVRTVDGRGIRNAIVTLTGADGTQRTVRSSSFGYYNFEDVAAGGTYVIGVASKRYSFAPRTVQAAEDLTDVDFVAVN